MRKILVILSIIALTLAAIEGALVVVALRWTGFVGPLIIAGLACAAVSQPILLVAIGLALVMAARQRDWPGLALLLLGVLGSIVGPLYAGYAISHEPCPDPRSFCVPNQNGGLVPALVMALVALPLLTLAYALLLNRRTPRLSVTGALVAAILTIPLIAAPPWIALNPAAIAPYMTLVVPTSPADCAHGQYPVFGVLNSGGGTLRWRFAFAAFGAVTTDPTSGTLGPGQSQSVAISGAYAPPPDRPQEVGVELDSNGGNQRVIVPCA
ncbi:MAG TPA: hypothetical protein VGR57_01935 [Ktedonobacterales bacterium]|nr:hypothetical protein [Ktedonobacterales bacterium]